MNPAIDPTAALAATLAVGGMLVAAGRPRGAPRLPGPTRSSRAARRHGALVARRHGALVARRHGALVARRHGALVARTLADAGVADDPARAVRRWVAVLALGPLAAALAAGIPGAAISLVGLAVAPLAVAQVRRAGRAGRRDAQLPEALDRIASALRSGASLTLALDDSASSSPEPLASELRAVVAAVRSGQPLARALDDWASSAATPAVQLAAAALALGAETGGAIARALDGVAQPLRDRRQIAGETKALATQARASAALIAVAPLGFAAIVAAADPAAARTLFATPLGLLCLAAGLALEAAGAAWMARIVREAR